MRRPLALAVFTFIAACQRTPEQQQTDNWRREAKQQGSAIENRAAREAEGLQQQADSIGNVAKAAGGITGERLQVRADALDKEAQIVRRQGDRQSDAVKEAADARIEAHESR